MFKNKYTNAFSYIELIMSLIIMVLISSVLLNVLMKKAKMPKKIASDINNEFICNPDSNDPYKGIYNPAFGGCDFYLAPCAESDELRFAVTPGITTKEFFEIHLTGGGAGGSSIKGGGAGEEKIVHYPSLIQPFNETNDPYACNSPICETCGNDGACTSCQKGYKFNNGNCEINFKYRAIIGKGGQGSNGGQTSIQIVEIDTGNVLGVLETAAGGLYSIDYCEDNGSDNLNSCTPQMSSSANGWGSGGALGEKGKDGEVIISW